MKNYFSTFIKENHFITTILLIWLVVIILGAVYLLRIPPVGQLHIGSQFPPGYIPPIDSNKINLIMSQPDYAAKPVTVSNQQKQQLLNKSDPNTKAIPPLTEEQQQKILLGQ